VKIKISQSAVKFVSSTSPREVRSAAARGLIPLSPRDIIKILYILCHDRDEGVRKLAEETISGYPTRIVDPLLTGDIEPVIIDYLVRHHREGHLLAEKALLNRNTSDETLVYLASGTDLSILSSLSTHHERLLGSREILDALLNNPAVRGALRQAMLELADPRNRESAAVTADRPEDVTPQGRADTRPISEDRSEAAALESDNLDDIDAHNIVARIRQMSVAEKIKYATRGNKEARNILMKDSSKLVVAAVIKSPKVTEEEILRVAQNKQANEEAIRLITLNKEWVKNYSIRLALVYNPKTPVGVAMRLMPYISKKDLKDLAGSKNVPSAVSANAKKLVVAKIKTS
jgi:hypothetical protein